METNKKTFYGVLSIYMFVFGCIIMLSLYSCNTIVKDEPEIEKVVEDGTKEIVEDVIKFETGV